MEFVLDYFIVIFHISIHFLLSSRWICVDTGMKFVLIVSSSFSFRFTFYYRVDGFMWRDLENIIHVNSCFLLTKRLFINFGFIMKKK